MSRDKGFDLIVIGDSTVDTFIKIGDATLECDIHHEECKICIKYGDKIPVEKMAHGVAGNAANVSSAASKLGLKTALYTNLGDDVHGQMIRKVLAGNGVSEDYLVINKNRESNLSVVLTFNNERTIFVYHQPWKYKLPRLAFSKWIYLTSVAESFKDSNLVSDIVTYVDKNKARLVFAPGTFQIKADVKKYPRLLERCEVLIVNLEESKKILRADPDKKTDPRELLAKLLLFGPKLVVITDGEEGSYASDGNVNLKARIFPSKVVEKTGAGDAYAAGLTAALFYGEPLSEAMIWGTLNAGHVIREIGAQNGLLTKAEISSVRKVAKDLVAVRF